MTILFLVIGSACGVTLVRHSRWGVFSAPLLALLMCAEYWPVPVSPSVVEAPTKTLHEIKSCLRIKALLDLSPLPQRAMYRQTFHEKPIVGGYLARSPRTLQRTLRRNLFLKIIPKEQSGPLESERLRTEFEALQVDALLVEADQVVALKNLRALPWLQEAAVEKSFLLFERRAAPSGCFNFHGAFVSFSTAV